MKKLLIIASLLICFVAKAELYLLNTVTWDYIPEGYEPFLIPIHNGSFLSNGVLTMDKMHSSMQDYITQKVDSSEIQAVALTGSYASLSGLPSLATVATSGSFNDLLNKPSIAIASTDFSVSGSPLSSGGIITLNLNTSGVSADIYSGVTVSSKGVVTSGTKRSQAQASRTLNNGFQISASRDSLVNYSVEISCTTTLLSGQTGTVFLEIASDSGFTTDLQELARAVNGNVQTVGLSVTVVQTITGTLSGVVPSGFYARLRTANTTGSPSFTYRVGQEALL